MSEATLQQIRAFCSCGKKYLVHPKFAGKSGRCPSCKEYFVVPESDVTVAVDSDAEGASADKPATSSRERAEKVSKGPMKRTAQPTLINTYFGWTKNPYFQIVVGICLVTIVIASIVQAQMDGPTFIWFYFCLGVACCIGLLASRLGSWPLATCVLLILTYESIGLMRWGYGLSQGMHKFQVLHSMMLFGPLAIGLIPFADKLPSSSGGSWADGMSSSCSSGSSCGGGGCGGGGCGGCGG